MKQSGGYVAVDSELGVGSAFTIYLRRADGVVPEPAEPAHEPAPVAVASAHALAATSTRVLVVEDEEVIRGLVDQILRGEGYEVLLAADGDEAIELADGNRVDVLLTDLTMPGIGGHELADKLRAGAPASEGDVHVGLRRREATSPPRRCPRRPRSSRSRSRSRC